MLYVPPFLWSLSLLFLLLLLLLCLLLYSNIMIIITILIIITKNCYYILFLSLLIIIIYYYFRLWQVEILQCVVAQPRPLSAARVGWLWPRSGSQAVSTLEWTSGSRATTHWKKRLFCLYAHIDLLSSDFFLFSD